MGAHLEVSSFNFKNQIIYNTGRVEGGLKKYTLQHLKFIDFADFRGGGALETLRAKNYFFKCTI